MCFEPIRMCLYGKTQWSPERPICVIWENAMMTPNLCFYIETCDDVAKPVVFFTKILQPPVQSLLSHREPHEMKTTWIPWIFDHVQSRMNSYDFRSSCRKSIRIHSAFEHDDRTSFYQMVQLIRSPEDRGLWASHLNPLGAKQACICLWAAAPKHHDFASNP